LNCKTQWNYAQRREKLQLPPKLDLSANAKKHLRNTILKHFLKGILKRKSQAPKLKKTADKSHSNTIYSVQLQKTIVLRMQLRHQATLTQPLQCVLQHHVANSHVSMHMATEHDNNHAAITLRSATRDSTSE